jgi:PAS domain S-box-containing protein
VKSTLPDLTPLRGRSLWLWSLVAMLAVAGMGVLSLRVFPSNIVPLAYAMPLLLTVLHGDLRLHWGMAAAFAIFVSAKWGMHAVSDPAHVFDGLALGGMQLLNILVPAAALHALMIAMGRLRGTLRDFQAANAQLEASNAELAAREEEINQQNEELQVQTEELEQQTEELSTQAAEMQTLNEQLATRERTLSDLLEVSTTERGEKETLEQLGEAIARLFGERAKGAAILEPDGSEMRVLPMFGLHADGVRIRRERTLADMVVARDRAGYLANVEVRPDLDVARLADGERARSVLAAPVRCSHRLSVTGAALEIYSDAAGDWSQHDLRLAQWLAEQLGRTWGTARLRQELDIQRRLLRTVTDNSSVALFMLDREGVCTYANPAAESTTGYAAEELAERPLFELLKPTPERPGVRWPNGEHVLRRRDGQQFIAACGGTPVQDDENQPGLVVEVRDISEQRRIAAEREQLLDSERTARGAAEHANHAKDEFVATLSHELRTPLNAILGWATLVRNRLNDPDEVAKGIEVIERNARQQGQLISDLLDMSKIIAGKVRLDVQSLDLVLVIEAAIDAVRPAAEAREVRLEKILEPVDRIVMGDPNRLQQVIWNLLTNAVKFTSRGGTVSVTLSRVASYVRIVVADTGQGIDPDSLPNIFERYQQGETSLSRNRGGLGLGLAIVKSFVELHGGSVHAASDGPGKGASFSVLLPVRAVDTSEPPMHGEPHPASHTAMGLDEHSPMLDGLSILVVDDDSDARELVGRVLRDRRAAVLCVASGDEAYRALSTGGFDMLVSDIGMPGMDGYTLIRRVRNELSIPPARLPAIALTAFARSEDRTKALLAGFQSHISKPVEGVELIATIASVRPNRMSQDRA